MEVAAREEVEADLYRGPAARRCLRGPHRLCSARDKTNSGAQGSFSFEAGGTRGSWRRGEGGVGSCSQEVQDLEGPCIERRVGRVTTWCGKGVWETREQMSFFCLLLYVWFPLQSWSSDTSPFQ